MSADRVAWHDVECGSYSQDLDVWRALAAEAGGPVLDVGAGTGRVTLDLAARGVEVVALDSDAALLDALRARRQDVETVVADARSFSLDRPFALVIVPMQTVQLLGGPAGRAGFLAAAHAHLRPGGLLALALADALEAFDATTVTLPEPDVAVIGDRHFSSLPLAVVDEGTRVAIHRLRVVTTEDGARHESSDVIHLDRVDAATLEAEAARAGLRAQPRRHVPATDEHVGSTVVVLRA